MEENLVNINVNGADFKVPAGLNVIEACKQVGVEIPHFCYHEHLKIAGSCRMCLVMTGTPARDRATGELLKNPDGSAKIAWAPKPAIACATNVSEGMHVITDNEAVDACRKGVLEFILLNHPLDCPICDKAGECALQEYASKYGRAESRYTERKNVKPKNVDVGGKIVLDAERCILCSRCIRIGQEVCGKDIFSFTKRGSKTEISVYPGEEIDSNYVLNVVDACPVGALTEKAFRFAMRAWFLKMTKGISAESSAGVNTWVWSREDVIYRITPRRNDSVNKSWCCDFDRYTFKKMQSEKRLEGARIDASVCDSAYALKRATEILSLSKAAIVTNGWQTLEEQYVVGKLAKSLGAEIYMASHLRAEDDGMLLSIDETPNLRGAFAAGIVKEYPKANLDALARKVRSGEIKTILCLREDLLSLGFEQKDFKLANVVYCGVFENATSKEAKIALPVRTEFEKGGLWINRQWRLQEFFPAIAAPEHTLDDLDLLFAFQRSAEGVQFETPTLAELRNVVSSEIKALPAGCKAGESGAPLDPSAFASVEFPETNALNFTKNA